MPNTIQTLLLVIAGSVTLCAPAHAVVLCGTSEQIDLSNMEILPFGGEVIGAMAAVGEIVNTHVAIQFTAEGSFDAADVAVSFSIHDAGGSVGVTFSGSQLGWSGQGTFIHQFDTDALNGLLCPGGQPFSTFIAWFSNLNPGNGPIVGNFDQLTYTIEYGRCPLGDVNHDLSVNVTDLLAVITAWGVCPVPPSACDADVDDSGTVDVTDLLAVISNWGEFCPKCS